MAPRLSLPRYEFALVSINSPTHSTPSNTKPTQFHRASVLHINNYGESSFVSVNFLQKVYADQFGPDAVLPEMDAGTEVQLRSRFLDTDETRVTTHRILYTARFDIILRKDDWEWPVQQQCLTRLPCKQQSRKQRQGMRQRRRAHTHKHEGF